MATKNKAKVAEGFKKDNILSRSKKRLIFYIIMISIPCIQFSLFYIYVNVNSIALAFQQYTSTELDGVTFYAPTWAGVKNFERAFNVLFSARSWEMISKSLILYAGNLVIVMGLALIFSYYIAKKFMLAGFFRVILYLPHVISAVALVLIYESIMNQVVPEVANKVFGAAQTEAWGIDEGVLSANAHPNTRFLFILLYNLWVGFGANVMLFTGSMSGIDQSIIESAQLDGVNIVQEFIHIYIPMIFPTFVTFIVTGITAIFSNSMNLIVFESSGEVPFEVFGYYLYKQSANGIKVDKDLSNPINDLTYSGLSALGVMITLILVPITLIVRKLLETFGPRTD